MSEQWLMIRIPAEMVAAGVSLPMVTVRAEKKDELIVSGNTNFALIASEMGHLLSTQGDAMQPDTRQAYVDAVTVYAMLAIDQAVRISFLERAIEVANEAYRVTEDSVFQMLAEVSSLCLEGDAAGLGDINTLPTKLMSAAQLFHQGEKTKAREVIWPFLMEISQNETLSEVILSTFHHTGDAPKSDGERLSAMVDCFN